MKCSLWSMIFAVFPRQAHVELDCSNSVVNVSDIKVDNKKYETARKGIDFAQKA